MKIQYYNDRKGKNQSHEIGWLGSSMNNDIDLGIFYSEDPIDGVIQLLEALIEKRKLINDAISEILAGDIEYVEHGEVLTELFQDNYWTGDVTTIPVEEAKEKIRTEISSRVFPEDSLDSILTVVNYVSKNPYDLLRILGFINTLKQSKEEK